MRLTAALLAAMLALCVAPAAAGRPIVAIDTDVGDDIDDAYALAWALSSPRLDVRLVTTSFGDTALRARLVRRMLATLGRRDVAVGAGPATPPGTLFTQAAWAAAGGGGGDESDAVALTLDLIRAHPGRVTLIALAPLTTVRALMERDPATFAKLRQVLVMGGAIARGYDKDGRPNPTPDAEWNVRRDPAAFRKLLAAGVPVTLFPLDSTQVRPDAAALARLTGDATPATRMLGELTAQWRAANPWKQTVPTLFDAVPVAAAIDPALCPAHPIAITVDEQGYTRPASNGTNASVCLAADEPALLARLGADVTSAAAPGVRVRSP